ncbi:MAG: hypothetical protein WKF67_01825 [Rubrobacteraceae bacterium]|jgi:rubrerythrin
MRPDLPDVHGPKHPYTHFVEESAENKKMYFTEMVESFEEECERCGTEMFGVHCKLVCPNCGYRRDCSDP